MTGSRQRGPAPDVMFFRTPAELRRWFAKHHAAGVLRGAASLHWRPIVNGGGRAAPADYLRLLDGMNAFPSAASAAVMRKAGVDYVVVHAARYPVPITNLIQAARTSHDFQLVARVGSDYLFTVLVSQ